MGHEGLNLKRVFIRCASWLIRPFLIVPVLFFVASAHSGDLEGIGRVYDPDSDGVKYLMMGDKQRAAALSTEAREVRIALQYGLGYLPLMIARQYRLIEKHAQELSLGNVKVTWSRFPSGQDMNNALRVGLLDFASGGVAPLLLMWDKTRDASPVKGVTGLSQMPLYLNTTNPAIKSLRDFKRDDRIALPKVKTSSQAITLRMAAAKVFSIDAYKRMDPLTQSMDHPQAMDALLAKNSSITAHFASPPFQYQELGDARVRTVLSSYEVLGGPGTFTVLWGRAGFRSENPKTYQAVYNALKEATRIITSDKKKVAEIYAQQSNTNLPLALIEKILGDPLVRYTVQPSGIMDYAGFMHRAGMIKQAPKHWSEVFFSALHAESGS